MLEQLSPEQAKVQLLSILKDNAMADVVAIIKGMPEDKRKKILAEFVGEKIPPSLPQFLKELRLAEPRPVSAPAAGATDANPET